MYNYFVNISFKSIEKYTETSFLVGYKYKFVYIYIYVKVNKENQ